MIRLYERSVQGIKLFDEGPIDLDNALDYFEIYYEIEYKYAMITSRPFVGVEKRKDNILKILEDKGKYVIEQLAGSFEMVFENWLESHAINTPELWAKVRFSEEEIEDIGLSGLVELFFEEGARYGLSDQIFIKLLTEALKKGEIETFNIYIEDSIRDINDMRMERYGEDEEEPELYPTDIQEYIKKGYSLENLYIFSEGVGGVETFLSHLPEYTALDILQEMGQYILFPLWYKHWKAQGIDKTRATIEKIYKNLVRIKSLKFQEALGIINQATNATHQNGSMMEYYGDRFYVDSKDLESLSKMDTRKWDNELQEIGVKIK